MLLWIFRAIFLIVVVGVMFVNIGTREIGGAPESISFWTVVLSGLGMAVFVFLLDIFTPKKKLMLWREYFLAFWWESLSAGH